MYNCSALLYKREKMYIEIFSLYTKNPKNHILFILNFVGCMQ